MECLTLPEGTILNPLSIQKVEKTKHFWSSNFYVTVTMWSGKTLDIEQLAESEANIWITKIGAKIAEATTLADVYEEAREAARSDGYDAGWSSGHEEGHSSGYHEAHDAFWTNDREEYRINEYNLGEEAGRRGAEDMADCRYWDGHSDGGAKALVNARHRAEKIRPSVLRTIMKRWPLETSFTLSQLESALELFEVELNVQLRQMEDNV